MYSGRWLSAEQKFAGGFVLTMGSPDSRIWVPKARESSSGGLSACCGCSAPIQDSALPREQLVTGLFDAN